MDINLKQIAGKIYQDTGVMYFCWDKHQSSCDAPPFLQESQNKHERAFKAAVSGQRKCNF